MRNMKKGICIVGGGWGRTKDETKRSSFVTKLACTLGAHEAHNGGYLNALPQLKSDLNIWMPDIPNEVIKEYPLKPKGSCLIVSKVIRDIEGEHPYFQPLNRIFKMSANAVIAIDKRDPMKFQFSLIDALGNVWVETSEIHVLAASIIVFYVWSDQQIRKSMSHYMGNTVHKFMSDDLGSFLSVVRRNARDIVLGTKDRFFGNCSTRCMSLFPSLRYLDDNECFLVSGRNTSKFDITQHDMVCVTSGLEYYGDKKPSVDTPVQIALYKHFTNINYMIHGHAFFKDAPTTEDYYPCGDLREVASITELMPDRASDFFAINLRNHGFLIAAASIQQLEEYLSNNTPEMSAFRHLYF